MPTFNGITATWDFTPDAANLAKRVIAITAICNSRRDAIIQRYDDLMKYQKANYGTPVQNLSGNMCV